MKKALNLFLSLIIALIVTLTPFCAAASDNTALLSGLGKDFYSVISRTYKSDTPLGNIQSDELFPYDVTDDSATIYFEEKYLILKAEQYNLVLGTWEPIEFEHLGSAIYLPNLQVGTFYKIRISYLDKASSIYSFFTMPKGIQSLKLKVDDDKKINLSWSNPRHQLTEIFKKGDLDRLYHYVGATTDSTYKDNDVKQGSEYNYKLRFVCKNPEAVSFSVFSGVSTYIEEDINDIVLSHGYKIVKQTDINNRNIPYPYNDNNKTIGTSGCGVCSSLMVLLNTTNYEPKLEPYTKELIKAGARESYGSNMFKIAEYLKKEYNISYKATKDVNELKAHLDKGYMATAHVGTHSYFTTGTGHFVTVAGYVKGAREDKVIILDPGFSEKKYSELKRVEVGIDREGDGIVTAPFETLLEDCKGEYFVLFTPPDE